jgi:hypothetical protein
MEGQFVVRSHIVKTLVTSEINPPAKAQGAAVGMSLTKAC